ncbi:3-hydroxyisobutyrate dehydrogenase [Martelella sp. AMO21009]
MSRIAFIGLGNMGLPMAINLHKAGHDVVGFDAVPAALEKAGQAGLSCGQSIADTVGDAEIIITMLPNGAIVLDVVSAVLAAARADALLIDCSTIDIASARRVHELAGEAGLLSLDAPVSGGVGGAEAGTLTFMVGGAKQAFEKASAVLDVMGGRLVYCGDGGGGQAAKMCNNMLLGISMIGASEAFALAEKLGLSAEAAFEVISTSSGFCWSVNKYCPVPGVGPQSPADFDYRPGFATELMLKDLKLAQGAAEETGQATPMGARASELYARFLEEGGAGRDFSAIIEYLKKAERSAPNA